MMGQKKVEIFSRKFRKSLAKQFLEVAWKSEHYLKTSFDIKNSDVRK